MNLTLALLIAAELLCFGGGVVSVAYRHRLDDWYPRAPAIFSLLLLGVTIGLIFSSLHQPAKTTITIVPVNAYTDSAPGTILQTSHNAYILDGSLPTKFNVPLHCHVRGHSDQLRGIYQTLFDCHQVGAAAYTDNSGTTNSSIASPIP
jgi:hypothetical protein